MTEFVGVLQQRQVYDQARLPSPGRMSDRIVLTAVRFPAVRLLLRVDRIVLTAVRFLRIGCYHGSIGSAAPSAKERVPPAL
ncbi:hypothetical protein E1295_45115 [Nonomuraea mesophila]|uniref:Uncharacterized protein n=1 Tax=Nonomuraea mesophila TaxID=2530382 RepID=A0A4V2Z5L3_9ACTN|nr:hypothetical protein [Nonomuraea mesophila]TDE25045.1 hypothetical protein E1295_45115 [Nonomuraea mesophila]